MGTVQIKCHPEYFKVGRQTVMRANQILGESYAKVLAILRSQFDLTNIRFVNDGLPVGKQSEWLLLQQQWGPSLADELGVTVTFKDVPYLRCCQLANWQLMTGSALRTSPMPNFLCHLTVICENQEYPFYASEGANWWMVENMVTAEHYYEFEINLPAEKRLKISIETVLIPETYELGARRLTFEMIAGSAIVRVIDYGIQRRRIYTSARYAVSTLGQTFEQLITSKKVMIIEMLPVQSVETTFETYRQLVKSYWKNFWLNQDIQVLKDRYHQKQLRIKLYRLGQELGLVGLNQKLQQKEQVLANNIYELTGFYQRFFPIVEIKNEHIYLKNPVDAKVAVRFKEDIGFQMIWVRYDYNTLKIRPERYLKVTIAGRTINCPRQRTTVIYNG